jgi:ubiquinone/menaquinone biosynthesis C-methylase UbiE
MTPDDFSRFRCPLDRSALRLVDAVTRAGEVVSGQLVSGNGRNFPVVNGVPDLTYPNELSPIENKTRAEYEGSADGNYDSAIEWQFEALYENEGAVRDTMVDALKLQPYHKVLEVGCGTGRDSVRLARRLGKAGALYLQDLSPKMVDACIARLAPPGGPKPFECTLNFSISNATHLPFEDNFFDAVFHFGGFNQFGDPPRAAAEFARVTKPGGTVLYGDESVAPWLRGTEFHKMVCTNNPLFGHEAPLTSLPQCARDVVVRWIMGNCFYLITFSKGDNAPPSLNLDLPHKGPRGGTMRTRYFGLLEGVTVETKELARKAARQAGISMHEWLDRLVRGHAERELKDEE